MAIALFLDRRFEYCEFFTLYVFVGGDAEL